MITALQRRCWSGVLAVGLATTSFASALLVARPSDARELRPAELQIRRQGNSVSLVVAGVGRRARLENQKQTSFSWEARVVSPDASGLRVGTQQQVSLPTAGLESVMLLEAGGDYILRVVTDDDTTLLKPQISANGDDLIIRFDGLAQAPPVVTTASLDLRRPGRVPQPRVAPPLRARAVAPPVGDMAVGTMLVSNPSFVNVSGPAVTLTLKDAPAKDALMSLARLGRYGFVFVDNTDSLIPTSEDSNARPVTMSFRGERFDRALNSVLMAAGLQAKLDGRTLLVGSNVSAQTFGPKMSKIFRLNQADAESASRYLGNLGARITVTNTVNIQRISSGSVEDVIETESVDDGGSDSNSTSRVESDVYGALDGPLMGLIGTTDTRLNTVTLIGDSRLISLAQNYLRQIDLRTRQVAVEVKILSVSLSNDKSIDTSFSAQVGNEVLLGSADGMATIVLGDPIGDPVQLQREVPPMVPKRIWVPGLNGQAGQWQDVLDQNGQQVYIPSTSPLDSSTYEPVFDDKGRQVMTLPRSDRQLTADRYSAAIEAAIVSSSAKTLASPTLMVQEGGKSVVRTGGSVITNITRTVEDGVVTTSTEREETGLSLDVQVARIDDNGFITMAVSPKISVATPTRDRPEGISIFNVDERRFQSGSIRLRDGQALVLTGVITDSVRELATKWPILGDMPVIGQFFRGSTSSRQKDELVIVVTPRILYDDGGGGFGYGNMRSLSASPSIAR